MRSSVCKEAVSLKVPLLGQTIQDLQRTLLLVAPKEPSYRALQLFQRVHSISTRSALFPSRHELDGARNSSIDCNDMIWNRLTWPKDLRLVGADTWHLNVGQIISYLKSVDGTSKWLTQLSHTKGMEIESVLIPDEDKCTVCVSSQIGCSLKCTFCHTGTQKLMRNLNASEIVAQVYQAMALTPKLTNIVFMGQGEPLLNLGQVGRAIEILCDEQGVNISRDRITVSTSGIVPAIEKIASFGVRMAISLHAPNDDLRSSLVPINKTYPLDSLIDACRKFVQNPERNQKNRRITFEYVLLNKVNDSEKEAKELIRLLHGIPCLVNLIQFNPWPGAVFKASSEDQVQNFMKVLHHGGIKATLRRSRGQDIMAACGQLKSSLSSKESSLNM